MKRWMPAFLIAAMLAAGLFMALADGNGGGATPTDLATGTDLRLNTAVWADIAEPDDVARFAFTPAADRTYVLRSLEGSNTAAVLYDAGLNALASAASESGDFVLRAPLQKDRRYYLTALCGPDLAELGMFGPYRVILTEEETRVGTFFGDEYQTLIWTLDSSGTLTLSGSGGMADGLFSAEDLDPSQVTALVLAPGITRAGASAFVGFTALERVTLPGGPFTVGASAFDGCAALTDVYYPGTARDWAASVAVAEGNAPLAGAVRHCTRAFAHVLDLPDSLTEVEAEALRNLPGIDAVRVPASLRVLDLTALDPDAVLLLPAGSPWIAWAEAHGFDYGLE